jgi:cytoskeleton protein RodZ
VASFGVRLKQEREKQSVTLDDISLSTKISTRMLRALEEERFDQLPGGIFNKGFIRAYAHCLGMDEEQAIADYLATISPPGKNSENDDQAPILEPPSREENDGAAGLPWGIFAVALLIVALGFAAWGFYSRESQKGTPASTAPAAPSPDVTPARVAEPSASLPTIDSGAATAEVAHASQPTVPSTAGGG